MADKFKLIASVYLVFRRGDEILLLRRANTGFMDGHYGLVAGHVDGDESLTVAAAREAKEESGVTIDPKDLVLRTVMHRKMEDERMDFFFEPLKWEGEITNTEPDKCDDLSWFNVRALPENTIEYIRQAIDNAVAGKIYSEYWKPE